MNGKRRSQGVALITVLLVLGLASVAVVSMSTARQADIRRTDNQLLTAQRWELVQALEQQAIVLLTQAPDQRGAEAEWQRQPLSIEAAGMAARADIEDLQGRLNLNNLIRDNEVSGEDVQRLKRLLSVLKQPPELVDAIIDWIDTDSDIRYPHGAEDESYGRRKPPYRAANRAFVDLRELKRVDGVNQEIYQTVSPYLYVADGYTPLNVNVAPPQLLRTLADGISQDLAESMFRAGGKPFEKIEDFLDDEAVERAGVGKYGLSVSSEQFQLHGEIDGRGGKFRFVSRLARRGSGKPQLLYRRRLGLENG